MKRALLVIPALLVLSAMALVVKSGSSIKSGRSGTGGAVPTGDPPAAALPDVRVRHEFITVSVPPVNQKTAPPTVVAPPATAALPSANRSPAAPIGPDVANDDDQQSFLERAGRAVIGDGRYRPEPFPRVKDN